MYIYKIYNKYIKYIIYIYIYIKTLLKSDAKLKRKISVLFVHPFLDTLTEFSNFQIFITLSLSALCSLLFAL